MILVLWQLLDLVKHFQFAQTTFFAGLIFGGLRGVPETERRFELIQSGQRYLSPNDVLVSRYFSNNFKIFKFTINPVPFRNKWVLYNFSRSGPQNGLSNSSICQKRFQIRSPVLGIVDCYRVSFVFIQFELSIIKTTHSTTQ